MFYTPISFPWCCGRQIPSDGNDPFWCLRLLNAVCFSSQPTISSTLRQGTEFIIFLLTFLNASQAQWLRFTFQWCPFPWKLRSSSFCCESCSAVHPTVGTGSVAARLPTPTPSCRHHVIYPSQARPQLSETSNKSTVKREEKTWGAGAYYVCISGEE